MKLIWLHRSQLEKHLGIFIFAILLFIYYKQLFETKSYFAFGKN